VEHPKIPAKAIRRVAICPMSSSSSFELKPGRRPPRQEVQASPNQL